MQELYPGNQEPFQKLGIFPLQEPGSGVVSLSHKSPCSWVVVYNGPATSWVGAASLLRFRILIGQMFTMFLSLGNFMSYWETVYTSRAFVLQYGHRYGHRYGRIQQELCLASLFRLFYNNQQYASGMLTLALCQRLTSHTTKCWQ